MVPIWICVYANKWKASEFQLRNYLVPPSEDPQGVWVSCTNDPNHCSAEKINIIQGNISPNLCSKPKKKNKSTKEAKC